MANQRIKVDIARLIIAIEDKRAAAVAEYEAADAAYEPAYKDYCKAVAAELREIAKQATLGKLPKRSYGGGVDLDADDDKPTPPSKPNLVGFDKDIALLQMAAESTISLSVDDRYARYL